jgi:hypothetical protein
VAGVREVVVLSGPVLELLYSTESLKFTFGGLRTTACGRDRAGSE